MKPFVMLLLGAAVLPVCLYASEPLDSVAAQWQHDLELGEVVVVAKRPVLKHDADRIVYIPKNDPYALGLNSIQLLDRLPRISVVNDQISVAGKSSVRFIIDGRLLEMPYEAVALQLRNLNWSSVDKIELITTPPAKYAAGANVAYISITTRNESLGTRGNIWGSGTAREDFSSQAGGNICHTTRKVELSADVSVQNMKGINDLERIYTFLDHLQTSVRSNHFVNRSIGANGLFKYKFNNRLSSGAVINFNDIRQKSFLQDVTVDHVDTSRSQSNSPSRPNNAMTLTAFGDWSIDPMGKTLSLTYNYYNRYIRSFTDVKTAHGAEELSRLKDYGTNKYRIHSVKLDVVLPFRPMKIEAGASFTGINNHSGVYIENISEGGLSTDISHGNSFRYSEKTMAAYLSCEKSFSSSFFCKLGLRYEHSSARSMQLDESMYWNKNYGKLFPTMNISWNNPEFGRLSLSYSMGITRPNFNDLNPFRYYSTVADYFSGNPFLDPSISHNAEINYSYKGIYAVFYHSFTHDAVGYVTRFSDDGSRITMPENCLNADKTGLYASYNRALFSWWNMNVGGEVFYSHSKAGIEDFRNLNDKGWSGKVELNTSWMLNRDKTLILNLRCSHLFPWHDKMVRYSSVSLVGLDLRYALFNNRLNMSLSVNDPFKWNVTKSKVSFKDYTLMSRNDIHSHGVTFRVSWAFGGHKVNNVYRDTKEHESRRAN